MKCAGLPNTFHRFVGLFKKSISFPLSCLCVELISAWSELSYINAPIDYGESFFDSFLLFDIGSAVAALCILFIVRRFKSFAPLVGHPAILATALILMISSTCINFAMVGLGIIAPPIMIFSPIIGGIGLALMYVMWWEVLGCLNPLSMLTCYILSVIGRVAIIWVCSALPFDRLWVCLCVVVVALVACLWHAWTHLSEEDVPNSLGEHAFILPVKPLVVDALSIFAFAFISQVINNVNGTRGNLGALIVAVAVGVIVVWQGAHFKFKRLWQLSLVCIILAVVPFGLFGGQLFQVAGIFESASYEVCLMLIYAIFVNLVYRYGASATWLFSLDLLTVLIGHLGQYAGRAFVEFWPWDNTLTLLVGGGFCVVLLAISMAVTFSIRGLDGIWSTIVKTPLAEDFDFALEKSRLGIRCHEIAQENDLTKREEEILLLLLHKQKPADIAKQLVVEISTVRTHIKHIHQKLGVRSNKELLALVGEQDLKG